jgi:hypothetical protein
MSRRKATLSKGELGHTEGEAEDAGLRIAPVRHTYNLRNKQRKSWAATEPKVAAPNATMPGVGEEADNRHVGGHGNDDSVLPSEVDDESGASGAERSGDLFDESEADSDVSSDWAESRSRITTPNSSTPSSPRRRSGEEEEVLRRQTVVKGVAAPPGQPHPRDERTGAVSKPRRVSSTAEEGTDPADLEARSVRLIEQLQNFIRERENAIVSPRNDPHISEGRMAPGEAEARTYGRHGPQTSHLFGADPAEPGTTIRSPAAATRLSDTWPDGPLG